jgi:leucyl aminopeptidase (aminopeptidase T)
MSDLERAVETVVKRCLGVGAGEELLVVCDPDRTELGHALLRAGLAAGADAVLAVLPPRPERGTEPPAAIAAAFAAADVFVAPCLPSLSHTVARKEASERGVRGATMPGATADLVARLMSADFDAMAVRCAAVADLLTSAGEAHLTCPRGTDMRFDLQGRTGIPDDGDLTARGAFGNLPCGEGFVAPLGGEGTIAASVVPGPGVVAEPVLITVRDGLLADASGEDGAAYVAALTAHGEAGRNLAELGVGTNDRATVTGNILEDEKILGTAHVAFGASASIGGAVAVPVHLDVVVLEPSLTIGGTPVIDAGRFLL